jgi:hypothetical protein
MASRPGQGRRLARKIGSISTTPATDRHSTALYAPWAIDMPFITASITE